MGKKTISKEESRNNKIYNLANGMPVDEKSFFLEAGQGRNVNGNVFALLKSIRRNPAFDDYKVSFALINEKQEEAKLKLDKYGIGGVEIVEFGSDEYKEALATSKYLITDNSFPAYFYKRPEQIYLNTWHGTPLKTLGRTDIRNAVSIANVQANMAKADYLLHPNRFTKDIMMRDFMMDRAYKHKTVVIDYPRNDALYKREFLNEISERYGLEGKRAIAYMPTWRGSGRDADIEDQIMKTEKAISEICEAMGPDDVLFVNLHFLIGNNINLGKFEAVHLFPVEYETYDFLAACDVLISDYSSVSMDFAGTGRDIILYLYDYDQYKADKGFYLDVKDLPFKKAYDSEELKDALQAKAKAYTLDENLRCETKGGASEIVLGLICSGEEEGLEIEDFSLRDDSANIAYFENINREESREIIGRLYEEGPDRWTVMFPNNMDDATVETLRKYVREMDFIRISGRMYCSNEEFRTLALYKKYGLFKRRAEKIYAREYMRQIGQFRFDEFEIKQCKNKDRLNIIKTNGYSKDV